jgi:hypothetical protein
MIVEHPTGALFVTTYGESHPLLWRSSDHGATWSRVNVGDEADGAIGNSDVDLAVAPDGTLYFMNLVYDREVRQGTHISIGVSRDIGVTWRWSLLSKERLVDRPWVAVSTDGVAHVVWSDDAGVHYSSSHDRGLHWSEPSRIAATGQSSHIAVGPGKEIAVRLTPLFAAGARTAPGVDRLTVSIDGGATWHDRTAPGEREWKTGRTAPPRWVEPLAWDSTGSLHSCWTNASGLWLARSIDQGETWATWLVSKSEDPLYYPYLIARGRGELAASWFSGRAETMRFHVAKIDIVANKPPSIIASDPIQLDTWNRTDPTRRDPAGEYVGLTFLRSGGIALAAPIYNPREGRNGFNWLRFAAQE